MRFRFRLRTLLVLMLCLGTVSGYYGNRIRQLARERHGLEELGESWSGVSVRNYIDHPDFRSRPKRSAWQEWLEWPLGFFTKPLQNRCLLYTSPSPRDQRGSRMPSSA